MGAGCCRARVLPGPGPHAPPPRPAWGPGGPAWGTAAPDPSIANLRPGDKFHFNREPFIRQHLVVPEKAYSANGVHNPAFTSDGGALAVRPALPSLPTPPPSPAPVPPPRKKRRARPPQPHGPPPLPPSRSRAGSRARGKDGLSEDDEEAAVNPNDSILSPAHTMELLKRMAKVEGRLGGARAAQRARSMDSLDVLDAAAARGRSLPGLGSNQERLDVRSDGPRSLDLDLNKEEGVVGVASFSLQSWEQRRGASDERLGWGPSSSPATALQLLSPRQWRPLSPAAAGVAPDGASRSSSRASSPHQTATTKALSEFIKDTYTAQSGDIASVPGARSQLEEPSSAPTDPPPGLVISAPEEEAAAAHCVQCSADDETGECLRKRGATRDVSPDEDRPVSSASSTTESLGELEDDILHMLTTTSDRAESEAGDELALESDRGAQRTPSSSSALPSSELVRQQQRQYSLGDATRDSVPTVPVS